ncbi:hypothetical protein NPIL_130321 [Nephila pilipes]|uniref:Uncharacterized protein n=1 Tax=Nephila pilipes TaxID=299642 RepID=A0A8X6PEY5_NEPPI|nr:hypothetical protein NPIL_130321 [Nephila pilipes]
MTYPLSVQAKPPTAKAPKKKPNPAKEPANQPSNPGPSSTYHGPVNKLGPVPIICHRHNWSTLLKEWRSGSHEVSQNRATQPSYPVAC